MFKFQRKQNVTQTPKTLLKTSGFGQIKIENTGCMPAPCTGI